MREVNEGVLKIMREKSFKKLTLRKGIGNSNDKLDGNLHKNVCDSNLIFFIALQELKRSLHIVKSLR